MTLRSRIVVAVLWIFSLALAGSLASAQQVRLGQFPSQGRPAGSEPPQVISGNDIGFRPEGWQGKARTGTWVVRIDGQWVEAVSAPKIATVTSR
jgi:hypothetical protein